MLDRIQKSALKDEAKLAFRQLVDVLPEASGEFREGTSPKSLFCWHWSALGQTDNTLVCCSDHDDKNNLEWFLENLPDDQRKVLRDAVRPKTDRRPVTHVKDHLDAGTWLEIRDIVKDLVGQDVQER